MLAAAGRGPGREAGQRHFRGRVEQDGQARRGTSRAAPSPALPCPVTSGTCSGAPAWPPRAAADRQRPSALSSRSARHWPRIARPPTARSCRSRPRSSARRPARRGRPSGWPAPRSPRHRRLGSARRASTARSSSPARPGRGDLALGHRPAPSVRSTRSPGAACRTVVACLALGAGQGDQVAGQLSRVAAKTGGPVSARRPRGQRPLKASRSREKNPCSPARTGRAVTPRRASWPAA